MHSTYMYFKPGSKKLFTTCSCLWQMIWLAKSSPQKKFVKNDCPSFLKTSSSVFMTVAL